MTNTIEKPDTIEKSEAISAEVRAYLKERPQVVDAQPDAEALWVTINGRGRLTARVEEVYRKATKSKKSLVRGVQKSDLVVLKGSHGRTVKVNGAVLRKFVGAKATGRLSAAQRAKAFDHFANLPAS